MRPQVAFCGINPSYAIYRYAFKDVINACVASKAPIGIVKNTDAAGGVHQEYASKGCPIARRKVAIPRTVCIKAVEDAVSLPTQNRVTRTAVAGKNASVEAGENVLRPATAGRR